jgi:hypothetical protein
MDKHVFHVHLTDGSGTTEIAGDDFVITDAGALEITGHEGAIVVAYAPHAWVSCAPAARAGDRDDDAPDRPEPQR